jgi:hypothetical protein
MSNDLNKPSQRTQVRGLTERVTSLEQNVARVLFGVNQRFQGFDQRMSSQEEIVAALVELNGVEEIERIINEKRIERARQQAKSEQDSLNEGIADGYIIPVEKVGKKSIIVVRYFDKDGKIIEPGRAQLVMPGVKPDFQEKLLGQSVGLKLDLDGGGWVELMEIYDVDEVKAAEVDAAKQKAAAEKAADTQPDQIKGA